MAMKSDKAHTTLFRVSIATTTTTICYAIRRSHRFLFLFTASTIYLSIYLSPSFYHLVDDHANQLQEAIKMNHHVEESELHQLLSPKLQISLLLSTRVDDSRQHTSFLRRRQTAILYQVTGPVQYSPEISLLLLDLSHHHHHGARFA